MDKRRVVAEIAGDIFFPQDPLEKPYLIGSKCKVCSYVAFPKRRVCPVCVDDETMEEIPLCGKGTIENFAICRVAPKGFLAPYILARVLLDEGPLTFAIITDVNPDGHGLKAKTRVEVIIDKISIDDNGNELIGYRFLPV